MFARKTRCAAFLAGLLGTVALTPLAAMAQDQEAASEVKRLQEWLTVLNQELKAELDQILVLQQAQRMNAQMPLDLQGRSPDLVLVSEVEAARRRAAEQDAEIQARLATLLERTRFIDSKKLPVLERLFELGSMPSAALAPAEPAGAQPLTNP